jgi:hypothetical protein
MMKDCRSVGLNSENRPRVIEQAAGRPHLYSLFYVSSDQRNHSNLRGAVDDIGIFLGCASLLAKSARYHGIQFALVTNDVALVRARLNSVDAAEDVNLVCHRFERNVPRGIEFYSAHFKLDLFRAFGSGAFGDWIGLIDLDMVLLHPIPEWLYQKNDLLAYVITDQVFPEYGRETVVRDLERVAGCPIDTPTWYGGEFLLGHSEAFQRLAGHVERCWPAYLRNIEALHHVGDEMVVSSSLALAQRNCELVTDAGSMGLVRRWWTARTGFVQRPLHLASPTCVLHLPADKRFLAAQSRQPFHPAEFLSSYKSYARKKLLVRKLYNSTLGLFERQRRFVGSIS